MPYPQQFPDLLRTYNYDSGLGMTASENMTTGSGSAQLGNSFNTASQTRSMVSDRRTEQQDVALVWHNLLFSFFIVNDRQAPTRKQLECLHSLTMASQQALIDWFKTLGGTTTFFTSSSDSKARAPSKSWDNMLFAFYTANGRRVPDDAEIFYLHGLTGESEEELWEWFQGLQRPQSLSVQVQKTSGSRSTNPLPRHDGNDMDTKTVHSTPQASLVEPEPSTCSNSTATEPVMSPDEPINANPERQQSPKAVAARAKTPPPHTNRLRILPNIYPELYRLILNDIRHREIRCTEGRNAKDHGDDVCNLGCEKHFKSKFEVKRHQDERFPQRYWFCTLCGDLHNPRVSSLFVRQDKIRTHLKAHRKQSPTLKVTDARFELEYIPMDSPCGLCGEKVHIFDMQQHVIEHVRKGCDMNKWRVSEAGEETERKPRKRKRSSPDDGSGDDNSDDDDDSGGGDGVVGQHRSSHENQRDNGYSSQHHSEGGSTTHGTQPSSQPHLGSGFSCKESSKEAKSSRLMSEFEKTAGLYRDFRGAIRAAMMKTYDQQEYLPIGKLREYFDKKAGSRTTLYRLYEASTNRQNQVQVDEVRSKYLRVFAVLLYIEQGKVISNFMTSGLCDDKLPLRKHSAKGIACGSSELVQQRWWPQFEETQWKFHIPTFGYELSTCWPDRTILPFQKKEALNSKGGTATVYRVEIHPDYLSRDLKDRIAGTKDKSNASVSTSFMTSVLTNMEQPSSDTHVSPTYQFALKTFHPGHQELYEQEKNAYKALRGLGNRIDTVGFFGSFVHSGTHNIILEHADRGDLEEFFADRRPPTDSAGIVSIWKALSDLAKGLAYLHSIPSYEGAPSIG